MTLSIALPASAFLLASGLVFAFSLWAKGRRTVLDDRLRDLSGQGRPARPAPVARLGRSVLPRVGETLLPEDEGQRTRLRQRLIQAGLYGPQALVRFLAVKMLLMFLPWLLGLAAGLAGLVSVFVGVASGAGLGALGMVVPGFWLDRRKARRQAVFRRSFPDVLDILTICLEGGLSLTGAFQRVVGELRTAHPLLGVELNIVQHEMRLGQSLGEALRHFAERCDLEEILSLAAVIEQTDRFGGGLVKALRMHAETLREKRVQYAEEMAHKAGTKILFPTLLFIFPGVFLIVLGPAALQLSGMMDRMKVQRSPAAKVKKDKARR